MNKSITLRLSEINHNALKYSKLGSNMSRSAECLLEMYRISKFAVVKITNTNNNKVFIYIDSLDTVFSENYKNILYTNDYPISYDLNVYGWQSFSVEIIGVFSDIKHANFYMTHACNDLVDSCVHLYNDDILNGKYTKFIYIPIKLETYEKILDYCIKRKIKFKDLMLNFTRNFFTNLGKLK